MCHPLPGGLRGGVPPLPIPNREAKPAGADGTAMQRGRAGSRPFFHLTKHEPPGRERPGGFSRACAVYAGMEIAIEN